MKQKLTITGMFNDELTAYMDKECNVSMIVDIEEECECVRDIKCPLCKLIETGTLTDIE